MVETLVARVPPPDLNIPASDSIVEVSCIDSTTFVQLPMGPFLQPDYKGKPDLTGPAFSFLITHRPTSTHHLFDLGTRKDWTNLPPSISDRITSNGWTVRVEQNVATILQNSGIDVASGAISSVMWSHHHWDHIGDISTFPPSTTLILGPGFKSAHLPGYPDDPSGTIHASDFRDRPVREIDIATEGHGLRLGRFAAHDLFGDGSFYLLDTPGHSVGHMCGLARTTPSSSPGGASFVLMGGDACHHGGEFRPTPHLPIPKSIAPSPLKRFAARAGGCPGHLLQEVQRNKRADEPFYVVTEKFAHDLEKANWTIDGIGEFDAHDNVFVLIAHDDSVKGVIDLWPSGMNDWKDKGRAEAVKWRFLGDFEGSVREG